jgi:hypothetical protein
VSSLKILWLRQGTYLCIVEKAAEVTTDANANFEASSGVYEKKFLVTPEAGVKEFGTELRLRESCNYNPTGSSGSE